MAGNGLFQWPPQALLEEKHKEEDIEKMREAMTQIIQDAAMKTRKEVRAYSVQTQANRAVDCPPTGPSRFCP